MLSAEYQPKLDPDLPIHEQAENLPFDIRYEIPKSRLHTGKMSHLLSCIIE